MELFRQHITISQFKYQTSVVRYAIDYPRVTIIRSLSVVKIIGVDQLRYVCLELLND